jgi:hypothetical protein
LNELHSTLNEELLLEANMRGFEARLESTPAHPPTSAGTFHWHDYVAALRTELALNGWQIKNHKNCPFVISPDQNIMVLVMTGDRDTGIETGNPTNQADKGQVLSEAIQSELFEMQSGDSGTQLWILLYHVERAPDGSPKEIRTEFSRPARFDRKKIVEWSERIILRTIETDEAPEIESNESTKPIDVPVERRQSE